MPYVYLEYGDHRSSIASLSPWSQVLCFDFEGRSGIHSCHLSRTDLYGVDPIAATLCASVGYQLFSVGGLLKGVFEFIGIFDEIHSLLRRLGLSKIPLFHGRCLPLGGPFRPASFDLYITGIASLGPEACF